MTRLFFLIISTIAFSFPLQSQTIQDALRYSRLDFGGTARSMGVGGSMGALGTDFAVLSTNPAGLAAYRSSDFMFTPSFKFMTVSSGLTGAGNETTDKRSNQLLLDNIGYIYASQPVTSKWEAFNFGIGVNKMVGFFEKFSYEGKSKGSIINRFVEQAEGFDSDNLYPFEDELAFNTLAIYDDNGDNSYESDFQLAPDAVIQREEEVVMSGAMNELVFSFAGNYNHKLMVGITLGVPIMRYTIERTYSERDPDDEVPFFNDLTFTEEISTTGAGFNLKVGLIYRPIQMVRVGLAFHTPTRLQLTDTWQNTFNYDYTDDDGNSDETSQALDGGPFDYSLRTPGRIIGSIAVLIKRHGFISAELEYLNYAGNSFDLTEDNSDTFSQQLERSLNQEIDDNLTNAINFKVGGELAVDIFRIRAGYGMFGTSYAAKSSFDPSYSLGLGMRQESYYLDVAYKRTSVTNDYSPYALVNPSDEQGINSESAINKLILTLGFRF
jgi:hypothetical protein